MLIKSSSYMVPHSVTSQKAASSRVKMSLSALFSAESSCFKIINYCVCLGSIEEIHAAVLSELLRESIKRGNALFANLLVYTYKAFN